jgi:hypothetical protein
MYYRTFSVSIILALATSTFSALAEKDTNSSPTSKKQSVLQKYRDKHLKKECLIQLNAIQKGVRSYSNIEGLEVGDNFDPNVLTEIFGSKILYCPLDKSPYTFRKTVPPKGVPFAKCKHAKSHGHKHKKIEE